MIGRSIPRRLITIRVATLRLENGGLGPSDGSSVGLGASDGSVVGLGVRTGSCDGASDDDWNGSSAGAVVSPAAVAALLEGAGKDTWPWHAASTSERAALARVRRNFVASLLLDLNEG